MQSTKGILQKLFESLASQGDPEWLFLDSSIVNAHQDSSGAAGKQDEAIGKSRGGNSTKIHLAVDSSGLPVYFELSGGQVNDIVHAQCLIINSPQANAVCADRCLYRYRHLAENAFLRIERYRAISTRYDKLARNYSSTVALAFMMMWLPMYL